MKTKSLTVLLFFQLITLTLFAQKDAALGTLLNKNGEFIFPQTPDKISAVLKVKADFYEDANEEQNAKWLSKSGLELYCSLDKNKNINEMSFDIPEDQFVVVSGLPFNLIMNKTTLSESMIKFSKYKVKKEKFDQYSTFSGGAKLIFKKDKHYVTLFFDSKNLLKFLSITPYPVDPAAN